MARYKKEAKQFSKHVFALYAISNAKSNAINLTLIWLLFISTCSTILFLCFQCGTCFLNDCLRKQEPTTVLRSFIKKLASLDGMYRQID